MPSELGQAAEEYARMGWSIMPIKPRDKVPMTAHGLKDATTNIDTIRGWWDRTPTANIGLNCGASGIVVVDLDKRDDYDGPAEWDTLLTERHLTVETSTSLTGGGGRHLLFKAPEGIKVANSASRLAPGVDVRGEGGYVVLPPSIHPSGKPYTWAEGATDIAPMPNFIFEITSREPDPWQIFTLRDALKPREPLVWVVEGIIPAASLSIWYGSPGSLKSMLLADMATCVAVGSRWLATPNNPTTTGYATTPGAVMWLDFDNGQRRTHERMAALARARQLSAAAPIYYASMPDPTLNTGDMDSVRALVARLVDRNITLLVIDNLGVVAGEAEENTADMQQPMAGLRWLAETGVAVIVLHHQRKSSTTTVKTRKGESLRGHGSIEAKLDLAIQIDREDASTEITMTPTKTRGPSIKPFSANFAFENDDHHELLTARFWPVSTADPKEEAQATDRQLEANIIEEVTRAGRVNGISANGVFDGVRGNRAQVLDKIKQMVSRGTLGQRHGQRGYLLYIP